MAQRGVSIEKRAKSRFRWLLRWSPILFLVFVLHFLGFFTWSGFNCRTEDIDIQSGRIRYSRFILWCRISERVTPSAISSALEPHDTSHTPEWRRVNTFSPGVDYSPHHGFHGAIAQAETLARLWSMSAFTPAAQRESAIRLLAAWQRGQNYRAARIYVDALMELVSARWDQNSSEPIDVRDLPSIEPVTGQAARSVPRIAANSRS